MPILSIIIDKIAIFTPIIIDTMDKTLIKRLIVEYQRLPQEINFIKRDIALSNNLNYVLVGLRRSGKSYLLYQKINDLIADGHSRDEILLLNFEDERLLGIQLNDLDMILECIPTNLLFFLTNYRLLPDGSISHAALPTKNTASISPGAMQRC